MSIFNFLQNKKSFLKVEDSNIPYVRLTYTFEFRVIGMATGFNLRLDKVAWKSGKPEEIAHAIYFLADNGQSSFMTGQALVVDGGATARLSTE